MNEDFIDFLRELSAHDARFIVVGAHALAAHGIPRATGDLAVWIERSPDNARRVWNALVAFGAPVDSLVVSEADLAAPETVVQLGLPPRRIDILTDVSGISFQDAWPERTEHAAGELAIPYLGRAALIANKRATGRTKDLADLESLER